MPGTLSQTATRITETTRLSGQWEGQGKIDRPLVVLSNRGPFEHHFDEGGVLRANRGQGGVITALSAVAEQQRVHWIAAAITEADHRIASGEISLQHRMNHRGKLSLQLVSMKPDVYHNYYNRFSNPFLWFLQHGVPQTWSPEIEHAWHTGYVPANQTMARAVVNGSSDFGESPVIMLHDYHLYLMAGYLRHSLPDAVIQHFVHIPWPGPDAWSQLAEPVRSAILLGLLDSDIVGLHTTRDTLNFLDTVRTFVPGTTIDPSAWTVRRGNHTTRVRAYPISVDVQKLRREARSWEVQSYVNKLAPLTAEHTIVRVDRLDPSKNIVRGFEAFELLLARRRDLAGKVKFLCFLVPSRTAIPIYRQYEQEVLEAARGVNQRHGTAEWRPVEVFHENNYPQALAAMQLYDVLLVNPTADGMNLVSKEGPIVNTRDGVLVLSTAAGSYEQLAPGALGIDPLDCQQTAVALEEALMMPRVERRRRAQLLECAVESEDLSWWLQRQLNDIEELASRDR